jgi:single-strand DNA-binding protein
MCRFSIAVNRSFVSKSSGQRETDFINVIAWRNTADFVSRYFSKGKPIIVEGSLRNDNYTDKNGVQRYEMRVQADSVSFALSDNSQNGGNGGGYNNNYNNNNHANYNGGYQQGNFGGNGNAGYQNGYGNNYGNQPSNDYYQPQQQPQPQMPQPAYTQPVNNAPTVPNNVAGNPNDANNASPSADVQVGNLEDFEEILNDGEIPF